jgi:predicted enzyme related to lactoylglutathione lyase
MADSTSGFRVTGIDMTGYMVKDTGRALAFYRDVLGIEPTTVYPGEAGAEYELSDGTTFGLFNPGGIMPWRGGTGVMFAVDDFDSAVRNAKARGATVHMEHESPVCFMAMTEDSEGNHFIIHKRKNA